MNTLPALLLDRPAPEGARWLALARLEELIVARQRLDDPDDREALHDFRVALRRFRILLRIYREVVDDSLTRRSRRRLSRLASAAGLSRDSEVRLGWLHAHVGKGAVNTAGVEWVAGKLARDRIRGDHRLQRAVARKFGPVVGELQRTLRQYCTTTTLGHPSVVPPTREVTAVALHALAADIDDAVAAAGADSDPELSHRVRIAARRLRYALEPLVDAQLASASVLATARAAIAHLTRMQDAFGNMHDEIAFDRWLTGCDPDEFATHPAEGAFVERLRQRLRRSAERRQRTLNAPAWRQRIARIVGQAHLVADGLALTDR
jgi:CHAD domain-containing protein